MLRIMPNNCCTKTNVFPLHVRFFQASAFQIAYHSSAQQARQKMAQIEIYTSPKI